MNKQIRELAKQSGIWFVTPREDLLNDFAELLIDEVYSLLLSSTLDDEPWPSRKEVKQHFGVDQ